MRARSSDLIAEVEKHSYSTHEGALELLYIKAEPIENGLLKVVEGFAISNQYQSNQFLGTSSSKRGSESHDGFNVLLQRG